MLEGLTLATFILLLLVEKETADTCQLALTLEDQVVS